MNVEIKKIANTIFVFLKRDLKERYARSLLGPIWIVIYPLLLMGVVTAIFSVVFSNQVEQIPYALFALIGFVHWIFFSQSISHLTRSFISQKNLIINSNFHLISIPISVLLSRFIDYLVGLFLIIVLFSFFHHLSLSSLIIVLFLAILQGFMQLGLGLIFASFNSFYQDVQYLVDIGLQILFYITPIIYPFSLVPGYLQIAMSFNPLVPFFRNYHLLFIKGQFNWEWLLVSLGISLLTLSTGVLVYKKYRYQIPEVI